VGPGKRFLSGLTYYTYELSRALSGELRTSTILIRRLLPRALYPGRARVGTEISPLEMPSNVRTFDGVDWFVVPSMIRALQFLRQERPRVVVLQWWTGTVLHIYLLLALTCRAWNIRVVVEFHEVQDPGEQAIPLVGRYVNRCAPWLFRMADGFVVHSEFDRALLDECFSLPSRPITVIPHATYSHYRRDRLIRDAPADACNLLFFGLIRPYKGLDDLITAFELLGDSEVERYWLTVVGESWEEAASVVERIDSSPRRNRITFVNRYVTDEEVGGYFSGADVVVLPYHRSSQSGALHIAMHYGLPLVVTAVGGLVEAVDGYEGAQLVPPHAPAEIAAAIRRASGHRGPFADPRGWDVTAERYASFYTKVLAEHELGRRDS
jgi:glycosyltransferase involved in cell wall biosynthesis